MCAMMTESKSGGRKGNNGKGRSKKTDFAWLDPPEKRIGCGHGKLTAHAWERINSRRIPPDAVAAVIDHGREVYVRGAVIYAIGRREVARLRNEGLDLSHFENIQVVCSLDGNILTAYRNGDFKSLKRKGGRGSGRGRRGPAYLN